MIKSVILFIICGGSLVAAGFSFTEALFATELSKFVIDGLIGFVFLLVCFLAGREWIK